MFYLICSDIVVMYLMIDLHVPSNELSYFM